MKKRRHHNNKGLRQIKNEQTRKQVKRLAKKYNIPYGEQNVYSKLSVPNQKN